jgi:hypothetical protein
MLHHSFLLPIFLPVDDFIQRDFPETTAASRPLSESDGDFPDLPNRKKFSILGLTDGALSSGHPAAPPGKRCS